MNTRKHAQAGFTLVEVMVALIILTVGVLGLAGTTALAVRQVTLSDVQTERSAALQSAIEQLRTTPFANLTNGSGTYGQFKAEWTIVTGNRSALATIVTTGPGLSSGSGMPGLKASVADTFVYRIVRP